jgi:lipopolysaccharide export LptBFGC system permease protein LptF
VYRALIRPRLAAPTELEDPRPARFAQLVGLILSGVGVILGLVGVTGAVPVAAAAVFIAAALNAVIGLCLGCELYLLGRRLTR